MLAWNADGFMKGDGGVKLVNWIIRWKTERYIARVDRIIDVATRLLDSNVNVRRDMQKCIERVEGLDPRPVGTSEFIGRCRVGIIMAEQKIKETIDVLDEAVKLKEELIDVLLKHRD